MSRTCSRTTACARPKNNQRQRFGATAQQPPMDSPRDNFVTKIIKTKKCLQLGRHTRKGGKKKKENVEYQPARLPSNVVCNVVLHFPILMRFFYFSYELEVVMEPVIHEHVQKQRRYQHFRFRVAHKVISLCIYLQDLVSMYFHTGMRGPSFQYSTSAVTRNNTSGLTILFSSFIFFRRREGHVSYFRLGFLSFHGEDVSFSVEAPAF